MNSNKVDFFIVGAMRSGTSSIRDALTSNPLINMAHGEPKFFHNKAKLAAGFDEYHALFDWENEYMLRGEKSPQYAVSLEAPKRIHAYNPEARIIWMFRNPVSRAISHYAHSKFRTDNAISLLEAIERRDELERTRSTMAYIYRSEYQKQMKHWLSVFPREKQFVLILEDVIANPTAEMQRLHDFLNVPIGNVTFPHVYKPQVKKIADKQDLLENLRPQLAEILAPTVTWMEEFLERDLPQWRTP